MATDTLPTRSIPPRAEFAAILRRDERFATGEAGGAAERINGWFDRLMLQSGLSVSPTVMLLLCVYFAVTLGGVTFVLCDDPLLTALAASVGGLLPVALTMYARERRQERIARQIPGMTAALVRTLRTGRNLEQSLELVAGETAAPLGTELALCVRKLRLGAGMNSGLRELPERTGLAGLSLFATALSLHYETGGNPVPVLERIARRTWLPAARRGLSRRAQIRRGLSDLADMLAMCLAEGLALDESLRRVGPALEAVHPILAREVAALCRRSRLGTMRQALETFATRCAVAEVRALVSLLVQADRLGTEAAAALREFGEQAR